MNVPTVYFRKFETLLAALLLASMPACSGGDEYEKVVAVGDSLTEGYQTGVAFYATQPNNYATLVTHQLLEDSDVEFELPLLTAPPAGRLRIDPTLETRNLGVGGAKVHDIVATPATATNPGALQSEVDRVLFPRTGTVVDAAVAEDPDLILLWIGNNDALGAVTNPGHIDGVQGLTPVAQFSADFAALVDRLDGTGADIAIANIAPVSAIAYLLPGPVLGLPAGVKVPLPIALGVAGGTVPPEALQDPDNLLTPPEETAIGAHIDALNAVIASVANEHGAALVDINAYYRSVLQSQPITIPAPSGQPSFRISTAYAPTFSPSGTSGVFSLDGVHASNTGYALAAQQFVNAINSKFDKSFDDVPVWSIAASDPYVDNDGDGCIEGPGFFTVPGVTGDSNDANPTVFQCDPTSKIGAGTTIPMVSPLAPGGWSAFLNR